MTYLPGRNNVFFSRARDFKAMREAERGRVAEETERQRTSVWACLFVRQSWTSAPLLQRIKRQDVILFFIFLLLVKFSLLLLYIMKINESSILICLDAFFFFTAYSFYKPRSDFKLFLFTCQSSFTSSEAISLAIIALCCVISLLTSCYNDSAEWSCSWPKCCKL